MTLQEIRGKKFAFNINHNLSVFRLKDLIEERIIFDFEVFLPSLGLNLQRPFVWTLIQKQQLILSILKGIHIPPLTLIHYKDTTEAAFLVIDGKQRLSAMIEYIQGAFPIELGRKEYFLKDLPDDCRMELLGFWLTANVGYEYPDNRIPDSEKVRWFQLINFAGTPQDAEHFNNLQKALQQ